jgi:protein-S-isoprenylcysteine O-methyltransferase Ste14
MTLVPVFEIGIWNAWIFVPFLIVPMLLFNKESYTERERASRSNKEKKLFSSSWLIALIMMVYTVFLPLQLGTIWFYIGLPITLLGLILYGIAWANLATTSVSKEPVTKGIYRYSRHPIYNTSNLTFVGVSIASASWLLFLLAIISAVFMRASHFIPEERFCLEKYGDSYRQYMNRTPRWIGRPKS